MITDALRTLQIEDNRLHATHDYSLGMRDGANGSVKYNQVYKGKYEELCTLPSNGVRISFSNNCSNRKVFV